MQVQLLPPLPFNTKENIYGKNQMLNKNLFLLALTFCFTISIDAKANCTPTDIPGICLPNAPNIPDGGISDGLKAGAKGVEQLGNASLTVVTTATNDTIRTLEKAGGDTIKTVEKAGGDTIKTTIKAANDLTATYSKAWADGMDQAKRSFQDSVDAVKAVGNYASNQAKDLVQVGNNAAKRAQEGKFVDAMWHLGTEPLQASEKNFAQATQESLVINAAAQAAAAAYGGPAGASAYTAWVTYRATGDADAALRAGLLSALTSQTGSSVANMPSGTAGELFKKSAMAGAAGGIAVAAAGGDEQAVKDAFLKSSGAVLIQGSTDKIKAFSPNTKDAVNTIHCISAKDVDCLSNTTYVRDLNGRILYDKNGKPRIDLNKLDPQQYVGNWTAMDPNSPEGKKLAFISKISKLPKSEAIPLMKNQWILTWTLGRDKTLEYSKPAVVLTYVGRNVPFISEVEYGLSMTDGMYSCPVAGFNRTLTTTKSQDSCETIYRREGGISQVIWHSDYHPESCAPKAATFIASLSDRGISCSAISNGEFEDSILDEDSARHVDFTGEGRQLVPVPTRPMANDRSETDSTSRRRMIVPVPVQ